MGTIQKKAVSMPAMVPVPQAHTAEQTALPSIPPSNSIDTAISGPPVNHGVQGEKAAGSEAAAAALSLVGTSPQRVPPAVPAEQISALLRDYEHLDASVELGKIYLRNALKFRPLLGEEMAAKFEKLQRAFENSFSFKIGTKHEYAKVKLRDHYDLDSGDNTNVIYMNPAAESWSIHKNAQILIHEVAHLVLGGVEEHQATALEMVATYCGGGTPIVDGYASEDVPDLIEGKAKRGERVEFELGWVDTLGLTHPGPDGLMNVHAWNTLLLSTAAINGHLSRLKRLGGLTEIPLLETVDSRGQTLLMLAAREGQRNVVEHLLSLEGVDPEQRSATGLRAADYARLHQHSSLAQLLDPTDNQDEQDDDFEDF